MAANTGLDKENPDQPREPEKTRSISGKASRPRFSMAQRIGVVALIVSLMVLAGSGLYLWSLDFGPRTHMPTAELQMTGTGTSRAFAIADLEGVLFWTDAMIVVLNISNQISWSPNTTELGSGPMSIQELGDEILLDKHVYCSVTDLEGDGMVDNGDHFTIFWIDADIDCTGWNVTIVNEIYGERLCEWVVL